MAATKAATLAGPKAHYSVESRVAPKVGRLDVQRAGSSVVGRVEPRVASKAAHWAVTRVGTTAEHSVYCLAESRAALRAERSAV